MDRAGADHCGPRMSAGCAGSYHGTFPGVNPPRAFRSGATVCEISGGIRSGVASDPNLQTESERHN